jgi:serine/threonine-protein kinase
MAFEVLTGKVPFEGEDVMEILVKNTSAPAPRPSDVCPALPPALDAPLLAFLEKDPAKRPATVGAGLDDVAAAAAAAGFDVKVAPKKTTDTGAASTVHVGGGATPADASARTILSEEASSSGGVGGKTVLGAESAAKNESGRRTVGITVAAAAVAVVAVAGLLWARGPATGGSAVTQQALSAPAVVVTSAPTATAEPTAKPAEPVPTVTPSAAVPAEVELTVDATPAPVDVYLGKTKIGSSAAPLRIKRADGKVKLTFKAAGYAPQDMDVPASSNAAVQVTLKKLGGGKGRGDLEF